MSGIYNSLIWVILFVLGSALGSFLNVFFGRYNPEKHRYFFSKERIKGRSRCDSCGTELKFFDLIPILSYLVYRGKCRYCKSRIAPSHFITEVITGVAFVSVPIVIQKLFIVWFSPSLFWLYILISILWILVIISLIGVFYIDLKYFIIPNSLNFVILVLGVIWVSVLELYSVKGSVYHGSFLRQFAQMFPVFGSPVWNGLFGMLFGGILFFLIVYFSGGRAMGVGDIKLISALGLLFGWPDIVFIISISFILGALYSLPLMIFKHKGLKEMIPFGPFIFIASIIIFYFGSGLLSLYFGII